MKVKTIIISFVFSVLLFLILYLWVSKDIWNSIIVSLVIFGLNLWIAYFTNKHWQKHTNHESKM
jgi:VIT1/CCC1 family predicted Fe2+/Mn2+ transporter